MFEIDTIHNADCLEAMAEIPDGTIDLVLMDPPYGVLNHNKESLRWDRTLPFDRLWPELRRISKPKAPIVMFAQGMFTADLMTSARDIWRYNLVWDKTRSTGFLNANRQPLRCHEDIVVFYQEAGGTYHPQMVIGPASHPRGNGKHRHGNQCYGKHGDRDNYDRYIIDNKSTDNRQQTTDVSQRSTDNSQQSAVKMKSGRTYDYSTVKVVPPTGKLGYKFPASIIRCKKEHGREAWHATQKPIELLRYLIRTYSNPGDVVFDACFGSGSTIKAAILEGRHYYGYEKDAAFFARASSEIESLRQHQSEIIQFPEES